MTTENTPADSSSPTQPEASALADGLQSAPTDTGWLQMESIRSSGAPTRRLTLSESTPPPEEG